jgi:two-component system phosphate regulon sensor histidine kinase PhoR
MAITTVLLWVRLGLFYRDRIDVHYVGQVERIAGLEALVGAWSQAGGELNETLRQLAVVTDAQLTAFDSQGAVLADSLGGNAPAEGEGMPDEVRAALAGNIETRRRDTVGGEPMVFVAAPVAVDGETAGAVRLAISNRELEATLAQARNRLLVICTAASILVILILSVQAGRTSRSLRRLAEMVERITGGDLNARVIMLRRDELGRLGTALNEMADKLQRQMKKRAREKDRLNTVMHVMTDGVMILDQMGDVRLVNPAAARLLRTSSARALRRSFVQVTRDHRIAEVWARCRESGAEQSATVELANDQFVRVIVTPLLKRSRRGYLVLLQDLTQLRRLQTVRQDFVSNVSHELRTPLASLHALVETLRDGAIDDPPAAARFLDRMEVEVDALTQMVEELLELSRIESGQAPLILGPLALSDVILPAVERLHPQAERAHVTFNVQIDDDLPPVLADRQRMQQVVTNLLHNAIKFSPGGGDVAIRAEAALPYVEVTVSDAGIGIPRDELTRVFERFYKTDRSRAFGGTGLGLAIAKHIVQAHGGEIWADSVEGEWSEFHFTLLVAENAEQPANGLRSGSEGELHAS